MSLVSLQQAADHLRLTLTLGSSPPGSSEENDLTLKLAQAEDIVLDYLKAQPTSTSPAEWDADTVPPLVTAAILLQLGELWRFRGDDVDGQGPAQTAGGLSPAVTNILCRYRDPALA